MGVAKACAIPNKVYSDFIDEGVIWTKSPAIGKVLKSPSEALNRLVTSFFRMSVPELQFRQGSGALTKGEVDAFFKFANKYVEKVRTGEFAKGLGPLKLVDWYVTESFAKRDPTLRQVLTGLHESSFYLKGKTVQTGAQWANIVRLVQGEATVRGDWGKIGGFKYGLKTILGMTAREKQTQLVKEINEAIVDRSLGDKDAHLRLKELVQAQENLISQTELSVWEEVRQYIEAGFPEIIKGKIETNKTAKKKVPLDVTKKDLADLLDANGKRLVDTSPGLVDALYEYSTLMKDMHHILELGVGAKIDSILGKHNSDKTKGQLKEMKTKLLESLLPNFEEGFYPHYRIDMNSEFLNGLMPRLDALDVASNKFDLERTQTIEQSLSEISSYISSHAKGREKMPTELQGIEYSPAFMNTVSNYVNSVNRFNFIAHADKHHAEALSSMERMYKNTDQGLEGYALAVHDYIVDLNMSATGRKDIKQDPQMRKFLNNLLGFEFISKMGINPRGAARNFTQRLLDYIEWGPKIVKEAKTFWESAGGASPEAKTKFLENMMEKGYLYSTQGGGAPELQESVSSDNLFTQNSIRYNPETNAFDRINVSEKGRISRGFGWVSDKAAAMHRWVENKNRSKSLQVGFYQMYKWLDTPRFAEHQRRRNPNMKDDAIERARVQLSTNYAERMMIVNHFDYNDFSKAGVLTKPLGRVLGQFQHFSFSFFRRTMELAKGAKDDITAGDYGGANAWKAYRYSTIYFLAPVLAEILMGVDIRNLVDNDTFNRLVDTASWFTADSPEEKKKVLYGRGPIMGNIGAPAFSDALAIGQLMDWINIDEDSYLALALGYQDMSDISTDRATYEKVRLLNTAAARMIFREAPQLMQGRIGWAVQSELGLYPSAEGKARQEAAVSQVPPEIMAALKMIEKVGTAKV